MGTNAAPTSAAGLEMTAVRTGSSLQALSRLAQVYARSLKWLTAVSFSLLWFAILIHRTSVAHAPTHLDGSALISLAHLLQQGHISGRDFHFTYGPAAQALAWIGTALTDTQNAFDAYAMIALVWCGLAALLVPAGLLLMRDITAAQIAVVLVATALLNLYSGVTNFRAATLFVYAVLIYRTATAGTAARRIGWAAGTGAFAFSMQLVTVELGLYAALIQVAFPVLMICFGALRPANDPPPSDTLRTHVFTAALVVCILLCGNLALSLWFAQSSPGYDLWDYQRYGWETIRGYAAMMGADWEADRWTTCVLALVVCYTAVRVGFLISRAPRQPRALYVALLTASLVFLRGAMTRSDIGHILFAFSPIVFVFLLLLKDWKAASFAARAGWAAVLFTLVVFWPGTNLSVFRDAWAILGNGAVISRSLERAVSMAYPPEAVLPSELRGMQTPAVQSAPLLIFPYDNYIGIALRRPLVAPVLQAYGAATVALQEFYLEGLESHRGSGLEIVYGLDDVAVWAVDGVQSITRGPIIFEYLHGRFALADPAETAGFYVLRRRNTSRRVTAEPIDYEVVRSTPAAAEIHLHNASGCGLIKLQFRAGYRLPPAIRRPAAVRMLVMNGAQRLRQINLKSPKPGSWVSTYVSFIPPRQFYKVFANGPIAVPSWDRLVIEPWETDWIGMAPTQVEVRDLECVDAHRFGD